MKQKPEPRDAIWLAVIFLSIGSYIVAFPQGWANEDGRMWPPSIARAIGAIFLGGGFFCLAETIRRKAELRGAKKISVTLGTLLLVVGASYVAYTMWRSL